MSTAAAARPGRTRIPAPILLALALVLMAAGAFVLWSGRGTAPFYDEWTWIAGRRGMAPDTLLEGHNGHLSLVPLLVYKVLLQIAGVTHYWVFRAALVGLHLLCGVLVFLYARRRVGELAGLAAAVLVLFLGAGSQDVLWAFQIGFLLSIVSGVGMLLALEAPGRRAAVLASVLLAVSLASSALGIVFLVVAVVELVLLRDRRRAAVVVVPVVLYGLWYLGYGQSELDVHNVPEVPGYGGEMASAAVGGLLGLGVDLGRTLAAVGAVAVVAFALRAARLPARTIAVIVAPLGLWAMTALARADLGEPHAPRYIYPGAVLVVLLAAELLRGRRLVTVGQAGVAAVVVVVAVVGGLDGFRDQASGLRGTTAELRGHFGAAELVDGYVDPGFVPAPRLAGNVRMASLREIDRDFGDIGIRPAALPTAAPMARVAADQTLIAAGSVQVAPQPERETVRTGAPAVTSGGAAVPARRGCTRVVDGTAPLEISIAPGSAVTVTGTAAGGLLLRRFADGYPTTGSTPLPAGVVLLRAQRDAGPGTWRAQVSGGGELRVCAAR